MRADDPTMLNADGAAAMKRLRRENARQYGDMETPRKVAAFFAKEMLR